MAAAGSYLGQSTQGASMPPAVTLYFLILAVATVVSFVNMIRARLDALDDLANYTQKHRPRIRRITRITVFCGSALIASYMGVNEMYRQVTARYWIAWHNAHCHAVAPNVAHSNLACDDGTQYLDIGPPDEWLSKHAGDIEAMRKDAWHSLAHPFSNGQ